MGQKPSLAVLYGQLDHMSTTFQTSQLVRALEPWITPVHLPIPASGTNRVWGKLSRLSSTYLKPLLRQPQTDFVLYGNDGAADMSKWRAKSLVYWYDAPRDWSRKRPKPWEPLQWLRYRNVIAADYLFAVSNVQTEVARRLRPGREDSVFYLPVGVNCSVFDPQRARPDRIRERFRLPDRIVVGYLGYIGHWQGKVAGQPLIDIAPDLIAEHDVHFLFVGFGPGLSELKRRVKELGLENRFTFTGRVEDEILPSCIAAMDICVDTLEEGFHSEARSETKLKQYMALGRACVATAVGENVVDLDHGRCGRLAKPGSRDLLQAVASLCENSNVRSELGRAARSRAERVYDWQHLARRVATALGLPE